MKDFTSKILKAPIEYLSEPPSRDIMPFYADPSTPNLSDISYFCDENPLAPSTITGIPDIITPDLSGISDLTEVNGVMLNSSLFMITLK